MTKNFLTEGDCELIPWLKPTNRDISLNSHFSSTPRTHIGYKSILGDGLNSPDCGLFVVVAEVYDELGNNYGKLIKFESKNGAVHSVYVSDIDLRNNEKAIDKMVSKGFHLTGNKAFAQYFLKLLYRLKPNHYVPYTNKTGYSKSLHGFMYPDGLYRADKKHMLVYDVKDTKSASMVVGGDYAIWKEKVAKKVAGYPIPAFTLINALSSLLLSFVDFTTIFLHFHGLSSKGKTLSLQLGASIFGNGSKPGSSSGSYISQWNGTSLGLQGKAALYNGLMCAMDELHKCADKDFPNLIYALCGGEQKARANTDGSLQQSQSWNFFGLSSGEQSGQEKIKLSGQEEKLGQIVRFIDTHFKGQIFTGLDNAAAGKLAIDLNEACSNHYGHASRDFMTQLLKMADNYDDLKQIINTDLNKIYAEIDEPDLPNEQKRVRRYFALFILAGYYAVRFDILPMSEKQVLESVMHVLDNWTEHMNTITNRVDFEAVLRDAILENIHLYQDAKDNKSRSNIKGYIKFIPEKGGKFYLLKSQTFKDIFKDHDIQQVSENLVSEGLLNRDKTQFKRRHRISSIAGKGGKDAVGRYYEIDASIIDRHEYDADNTFRETPKTSFDEAVEEGTGHDDLIHHDDEVVVEDVVNKGPFNSLKKAIGW